MAKKNLMVLTIHLIAPVLLFILFADKAFAANAIWDEIKAAKEDINRPYSFYADLGVFYNDNVGYIPPEYAKDEFLNPLVLTDDGSMEYQAELFAGIRYPVELSAYQLRASYTYYYTTHEDKTLSNGRRSREYDLMVHIPRLGATIKYDPMTLYLPYEMTYLNLGGTDRLKRDKVAPKLTFGEVTGFSTSVLYRFISDDYHNESYGDTQFIPHWEQDRISHGFGMSQQLVLPRDFGLFKAMYMFESTNAKGNDHDHNSSIIEGEIYMTNLPYGMWLNVLGRMEFAKYTSTHSMALAKRDDIYQVFYLKLSKEVLPIVVVGLKYLRLYNSSNIEEYDFIDNVLGVSVKVGIF